jgi:hypothetical protein
MICAPTVVNVHEYIIMLVGRSMVDAKNGLLKQNKDQSTKTLTFRPKSKGGKTIEMEVNDLLTAEIADQYKSFNLLQHLLHEPSLFVNQGECFFDLCVVFFLTSCPAFVCVWFVCCSVLC